MSTLKVGFLLAALTGLFVWIGNVAGGTMGMVIALILAVVMNFGAVWFSDKLVIKMTRAQAVSPREAPELHEMVDRLSQKAGIPKPAVYIVNDPSPNAFATGRSPERGVVAVNTGLLDLLTRQEVEGVVAHEIAHIKHRDTLLMGIVASIAGAVSTLANIAYFASIFGGSDEDGNNPLVLLLITMIAPLAAMIVQMGNSRTREYEADRLGAELAGTPDGLSNALLKLERGVAAMPSRTMQPSNAHMAIVNPFAGLRGFVNLFSTHPPIQERVRRLNALRTSLSS